MISVSKKAIRRQANVGKDVKHTSFFYFLHSLIISVYRFILFIFVYVCVCLSVMSWLEISPCQIFTIRCDWNESLCCRSVIGRRIYREGVFENWKRAVRLESCNYMQKQHNKKNANMKKVSFFIVFLEGNCMQSQLNGIPSHEDVIHREIWNRKAGKSQA